MKLNNKHVKESKKKQDNSDADRHTQYGDNTAVTVYDESWSWWGSCKGKGNRATRPLAAAQLSHGRRGLLDAHDGRLSYFSFTPLTSTRHNHGI